MIESFSASNLDDALDLLEVVTAKTDKASVGNMASSIEKHPEVFHPLFLSRSGGFNDAFSLASIQSSFRGIS